MTKIYTTRDGSPFKKKDAQAIGEFIENLKNKSPEAILKVIKKSEKNILHKYIEWNRAKASHKYQLQQIRNIVSYIVLEIKDFPIDKDVPIRAFYSISANKEKTYVSLDTVMNNQALRSQIIDRARTELYHWTERYRQYNELVKIVDVIKRLLKKKSKKKTKKKNKK